MKIDHDLKVWPDQFSAIMDGNKLHEFRKNDRNFQLGQTVRLREFEPIGERYLGGEVTIRITYISYGPEWGIPEGFCVFSFHKIEQ